MVELVEVCRLIGKAVRHPVKTFRMINFRRIKNCFIILAKEGIGSAISHYKLIEDYEKSRSTPLAEEVGLIPISERKRAFEEYAVLKFPQLYKPLVSIVIPVHNQFEYTYHCLEAILMHSGDCSYEVIVADDCSTDFTRRLEELSEGLRIVHNRENLGFLRNCNNAAQQVRGEYIVFLNNDTQVRESWLSSMLRLVQNDPTVGVVGAKLLYPDGYLQEAGGIIWKDGSAWNYGNRQNPGDAEFNYVRETDYVSGAAMMIRVSLWNEIGGFDVRYVPAYCEDSDLAIETRRRGFKVLYQPLSEVVHFEGISNGIDINSGLKKYQAENQKKFYLKWEAELEAHHLKAGMDIFLARDRGRDSKHVLVIDNYVPQYDKDAGSRTTFMYLKLLSEKGYRLTFLGDAFYRQEPYTTELQQMGILVLYGPKYAERCDEWLRECARYYDIFYLNRPQIAIKYIDVLRKYSEGKIIYYGHDLHFLRTKREYELCGNPKKLKEANRWYDQELQIMRRADMNYYPSSVECEAVQEVDSNIPVKAITAYVYDDFRQVEYQAESRVGILFVGGFGHAPNLDAVLWFLEEIYPEVYRRTGAPFYIVGSKAPESLSQIKLEGVIFKGFVSDSELQRLYDSCRISVVPLRYGAGVKGKVVEALYHGSPVVTTPVGAEGIPDIEKAAVIENNVKGLTECICTLYEDFHKLAEMSWKSRDIIKKKFSTEAVWNVIKDDF